MNGKVHATTNEIPFERLQKEGLSPLTREYIIDKINLRRVQKDCLISYAGNQYSVPAEYIGKDVAVVALDSMLAAYYEGKQIALHRISYQSGYRGPHASPAQRVAWGEEEQTKRSGCPAISRT